MLKWRLMLYAGFGLGYLGIEGLVKYVYQGRV